MAVERRQPLKVEVPNPKQETVRFGRVGIIVTVGFAIGVLWPRIAGFKLVPSVPAQPAESSSADLTGAPSEATSTSSAVPEAEVAPAPDASDVSPQDRLLVGEPQFIVCKSNGEKHTDDCDHVDFDGIARPHIKALAQCEGAARMEGTLSLGFDLDFESQRVKTIKSGRSTSLARPALDAILACARKEFSNVSLVGIKHQHDAYSVFYKVEFPKAAAKSTDSAAVESPGEVTEASGHATVNWEVALIRSSASRDGSVIARVLQGTRVTVTGRRGDWYRIKYDVKGSSGWVYRTAIGL